MQAFFSSDGSFLLQFLVIFLAILVLLMGAVLLFRRLTGRGLSLSNGTGQRGRQPRLGIVDIYELDRQRQLILLRRDNVEHLLLVGGPTDVVVERNIQRSGSARLAGEGVPRPELASDPESLPEAAAFPAPAYAVPAPVVPSLPPAPEAQPMRGPALDPALFEPEAMPAAPQRPRGGPSASRLLRRTPPPLVNPNPDVASERTASGETPPVIRTPEARTVDPAILSDMARQLEVALRRPASAVAPAPGRIAAAPDPILPSEPPSVPAAPAPVAPGSPEPPPPEPASEPVRVEPVAAPRPQEAPAPAARAHELPDPVAAAMAASQALNPPLPVASAPPEPEEAATVPRPAIERAAADAQPTAPAMPTPVAAPYRSPPSPPPASPAPAPAAVSAPAGADGPAAAAPSPFSVEEIEAEFARLLGRPLDKKG